MDFDSMALSISRVGGQSHAILDHYSKWEFNIIHGFLLVPQQHHVSIDYQTFIEKVLLLAGVHTEER